ncbi:MAG: hypothetical protein ABIR05_03560 [Luteimonas sp.]
MIRKLILPALAAALLAGCTSYQYRGGASGDYYYGQPSSGYNVYGGYGSSPYGGGGYGYSQYGNSGYYSPGYYPPTYYPPAYYPRTYYPPTYYPPAYYPRYPRYPQRPPNNQGPRPNPNPGPRPTPGDNNGGNVPGNGQPPDRPLPPWRDLGGMGERAGQSRAGQSDAGNVLRRREEQGERAPIAPESRPVQLQQRSPLQSVPASLSPRPMIVAPSPMGASRPLPAKRLETIEVDTFVPR